MVHYVDIIGDKIPKYIPFQCRIKSKDGSTQPVTSELLIRTKQNEQPISLKTKKEYIVSMNSTQILELVPHDNEIISYYNVENIIDQLEFANPINILNDGVMVFFTCEYSRGKSDYIIQVFKKLGDNWYSYNQDTKLWTIVNIKTNVLSVNLSSLVHKYICVEDLSLGF